jgi:hypothetical protein
MCRFHTHTMLKINILAITLIVALQGLPAFAGTTPLPSGFAGSTTDYIVFNGNSYPGGNLICFSAGCGGGFQGTIYGPGSTTASGPATLTTVWCVDYQLDVTTSSQYITDISTLSAISVPSDTNVRYGNLDTVDPTGAAPGGWANAVTDPTNLDGGGATAENSAAYRYTLAAALVSQYVDATTPTPVVNPTNLNGGSSVNQAIQEAIWYITYNSDYQTGATWPPPGQGISSPLTCGAGQSASNSTGNTNYACWVQYAEANANTVNTSAWAVVSGPADSSGNLLTPPTNCPTCEGYPSFQTFLAQVDTTTNTNGSPGGGPPTPEPTYFVLTLGLGGLIVYARRRRAGKQA